MAQFKSKIELEDDLIELVRDRHCLFDKRNLNYFNIIDKSNKWREVSEAMNQSVDECKKLWTSLRNQYKKHLSKLLNPSGSGRKQAPYFRHEGSMSFLKDLVAPNEHTVSNVEDESVADVFHELEDPSIQIEVFDVEELLDIDESEGGILTTSKTQVPTKSLRVVPKSKPQPEGRSHAKFGNKRKLDSFDKEILKILKTEEDEYDTFAKLIAPKLRCIAEKDRRTFLQLQQKIMNDISEAEIELLS